MFHYVYTFLKITNILYTNKETLLYFLPSLCISPSFVQIPNVLYWCSVRCIANTFLMVQTWHCIQFDIESVMQKHYRHKYLSFCPTSLLPRSPSVPHTFLFLPDPLPISPSLYFEVCFYFSELIFYIFSGYLSIYLSLPSGLSFHGRKGQKKHFWAIDPWKWKRKSPPMKKEFTLQHAGQQQAKSSAF